MTKTATASIEFWLGRHGDLALMRATKGKHLRCYELEQRYARLFSTHYRYDQFFRFGVIREPTSWVLSWYNFRSRPRSADPRDPRHKYYAGAFTFDEFVEEMASDRPKPFARIGNQHDFYTLPSGALGVTVLARYDQLVADLAKITRRLPVDLVTGLSLTRKNQYSRRVSLSDISSDTRTRIRNVMSKDLELYERAPTTLLRDLPDWDPSMVRSALAFLRQEYRADVRETFFNKWISRRHASWTS